MIKERTCMVTVSLAALLLAGLIFGLNIYLGSLNQDEGWYLYAAKMVSEGQFPFRDFAFTQGPVMPFVYRIIESGVTEYGLVAGRLFTGLLGGLAVLLASILAGRLATPGWKFQAGLMCFILAGINVYQAYFFSIVKTYALTSVLLLSGLLLLVRAANRTAPLASALAGLAFACAAGTRLSAGCALAVAGLYLLKRRNVLGHKNWATFAVSGAVGLCVFFVPFLVMNHDAVFFGLFTFHAQRDAGSGLSALVYKAGFISRMVQAYFVAFALLAILILNGIRSGRGEREALPAGRPAGFMVFLWGLIGLITLVHIAANFPYDDYQVYVYPLFCTALAIWLCDVLAAFGTGPDTGNASSGLRWCRMAPPILLVLCTMASFSSPVNQEWFLIRRDVVWWRLKEKPDLVKLRETAAFIREQAGGRGTELLTQDIYLAVEAGCRVPTGLEMGPFSYYPDWPPERAKRLHVVNRARMQEILSAGDAPVAALSGFSLAIQCPEVKPLPEGHRDELIALLDHRYTLLREIPDFGQAFTPLKIYQRKHMGYTEP